MTKAYDLYSGTYVEQSRPRAKPAAVVSSDSMRLHDRLLELHGYAAVREEVESMRDPPISFVLPLVSLSSFIISAPEMALRRVTIEGLYRSMRSFDPQKFRDDPKTEPVHNPPAREKYRSRAWQANQPGDTPWKGKRK